MDILIEPYDPSNQLDSLGEGSTQNLAVTISPVPFTNTLSVTIEEAEENYTVTAYNLILQEEMGVETMQDGLATFATTGWPLGLYSVVITHGQEVVYTSNTLIK